jgi:hypothetical protein
LNECRLARGGFERPRLFLAPLGVACRDFGRLADICTAAENVSAARALPSYDLLATASLCERGPDGWCKKLDQGRDVRDRFNIEDGLLNRRLAI